jgi:hypothetical protein
MGDSPAEKEERELAEMARRQANANSLDSMSSI